MRKLIFLLLLMVILPNCAIGGQGQTRTVTDMAGNEVVLPMEIKRIGTLGAVGVLNTFVETMVIPQTIMVNNAAM